MDPGRVHPICMEPSFLDCQLPPGISSISPDSQMSRLVTSGLKGKGWGAAKLWWVSPTQTVPHVLGHMGARERECLSASQFRMSH